MPDSNHPAPNSMQGNQRTEGERRTRKFVAAFVIFSLAFAGLVGYSKWREINQLAEISRAKNNAPLPDDAPENRK